MGGRKDQNVNDEIIAQRDVIDTHDISSGVSAPPPVAARDAAAADNKKTSTDRDQQTVVPLFTSEECQSLRTRWETLQVSFVDEPRQSVERADQLVCETINGLSRGFSSQRERLEEQWHRGQDVSTEDLRVAFRRYRSFFDRLLSM